MQLYILRHADADTQATTDTERRLSEKGEQQAQRIARFCAKHDLKPGVILTSPVRRAHETAKFVAERLRVEMVTVPWLACGAEPAIVLTELAGRRQSAAVMLVGHEPDLSSLISHLLGMKESHSIVVRKASLTALEILDFSPGGGQLQFSIPAKFV